MKIKITTDRNPWLEGRRLASGEEVEVSAEVGAQFIKAGFAEAVEAEKPKRAPKAEA